MNVCENCTEPIGDIELHLCCASRFGASLKDFRMEFRISLRDFSIRVGIESSYVSAVERGVINPSDSIYDKLLELIDEVVENDSLRDAYKTRFEIALKKNNILPWDVITKLPAFPGIGGRKPTKEEYDKLVDLINKRPENG